MRPLLESFKLCKIAPKFPMIMQTVQKYLHIVHILQKNLRKLL